MDFSNSKKIRFDFLQFLRKLNRQERVIEEVKLVLKPHYTKKHVTKDEYKDIMRRAVPKVSCRNRLFFFKKNMPNIFLYNSYFVDLS